MWKEIFNTFIVPYLDFDDVLELIAVNREFFDNIKVYHFDLNTTREILNLPVFSDLKSLYVGTNPGRFPSSDTPVILPHLQKLEMYCNTIFNNRSISLLTSVKELRVHHDKLLTNINCISGIESLYLNDTQITQYGIEKLFKVRKLTLIETSLIFDLSHMTELTTLVENRTKCTISSFNSIKGLTHLSSSYIFSPDIYANVISLTCEYGFKQEYIQYLKNLKYLNISGGIEIVNITDISALQKLEELHIERSKIPIDGLSFLSNLKKLVTHTYIYSPQCLINLKHLEITSNLSRNLSEIIEQKDIDSLINLEYLKILCNEHRILSFNHMKKLKHLDFTDGRNINQKAISDLTDIQYLKITLNYGLDFNHMPNLKFLDIDCHNLPFSKENMNKCKELRTLTIRNNGSIRDLNVFTNLRKLYISDTKLSYRDIKFLRNLEILYLPPTITSINLRNHPRLKEIKPYDPDNIDIIEINGVKIVSQ